MVLFVSTEFVFSVVFFTCAFTRLIKCSLGYTWKQLVVDVLWAYAKQGFITLFINKKQSDGE